MRVPVAPYPHQHLVVVVFWNLAILKVYSGVVYHCFNLYLPDYILCGASFLTFICHLFIFLVRFLLRCAHLLNWVVCFFSCLSFKNSLYILDYSPLLNVSFVNIFFQSIACFSYFPDIVFGRA